MPPPPISDSTKYVIIIVLRDTLPFFFLSWPQLKTHHQRAAFLLSWHLLLWFLKTLTQTDRNLVFTPLLLNISLSGWWSKYNRFGNSIFKNNICLGRASVSILLGEFTGKMSCDSRTMFLITYLTSVLKKEKLEMLGRIVPRLASPRIILGEKKIEKKKKKEKFLPKTKVA